MRSSNQEALTAAVVLHVVVAAVLIVLGLLADFFEEDRPIVLELVDLSPAGATVPAPTRELPPSEPAPAEPPPTVQQLENLALPTFTPVKPAPEIPAEPPPTPTPTPRPDPPKPTPPKPEAQPMSLEEYRRLHGTPRPTPPRTQPRPVATPNIDTNFSDLSRNLSTPRLETSASLSAAQRTELENYVAGIQPVLQARFVSVGRPGLVAKIRFTVQPNGTFANCRIERSSGDSAFDAAALATFAKARRYRPTPDGKTYEWTIDFRSVE